MRRRRSVTRRLLAGYMVLLAAFAVTMGLGLRDLGRATREAELLRSALVPLQFSVGEALAEQNVLAAQLNHATAAKNPADVREWIEAARRARPITLALARKATEKLDPAIPEAARLKGEVTSDLDAVDERVGSDGKLYASFFEAMVGSDRAKAEALQSEAVKYEAETAQRLRSVKSKTETTMEHLGERARAREQRAVELLVGLTALTLIVAAGITLYARRVLQPLGRVTERARAVASGDLAPRPAIDDGSEIGELAETFESMVGAIRDAGQELVKAERLAAIGKMAAHITHEIRNPLSAISLNLDLLESEIEDEGRDPKEQRELVGAIKAEANRLSRLSEQYLSLARRPAPALVTESLGELVEEILAFIKPELSRAQVEVALTIEPEVPDVPLDENLLRQAIVNLIRNAREAMTEGGHLWLAVGKAERAVELAIEDDGPGIPEEVRVHVFDPFFTTKQRGTGLGLAVTREIVEAHQGTIACQPREGGGTRFLIRLPTG